MKKMTFSDSACRLCGRTGLKARFCLNNCTVIECDFCEFVQLAEKPDEQESENIYGKNYFEHGKYIRDFSTAVETKRRLSLLEACGIETGSRVLDAGCATGDFIHAAKESYHIWGCDTSSYAIEQAVELNPECKNNLAVSPLEELEYQENFFDCICFL